MFKINNDSLLVWCIAPLVGWALWGTLVGIPIHIGLGIPYASITLFIAIQCVLQIIVSPWLFAARASAGDPRKQMLRRAKVVIAWFTFSGVAGLLQIFGGGFTELGEVALAVGTPIFLGLIFLLTLRWYERRTNAFVR
jgi:hypothetical protein